ncbi:MAG: CDP-alcohol phosphatidyltransferase family protein [Fibrobacteria bacterium]|nr:CDP-alcohol phosphatidyltransferase family protein [Fibrobacteria bacterium]
MKNTRYIIPNLFTGLNFILGIYAIVITASYFHPFPDSKEMLFGKMPLITAAWMITWCVLLDKLDGFAAKFFHASSGFGAQFDSLADLIAFGVAPAVSAYLYLHYVDLVWSKGHLPLLLVSLTVYALCAAMRLARYNAKDLDELDNYFNGLPSTFAGGFVAISIILLEEYQLIQRFPVFHYYLPLLLVILGGLMISPLLLPKIGKRKNKVLNVLQILGIASGYIFGFSMMFPTYLLSILIIYGVGGFGYCLIKKGELDFYKQ